MPAIGEQTSLLRESFPYRYPGLVERMSLLDRGVFAEDAGFPSGVDSSARPNIFGVEPTIPSFEADSESVSQNGNGNGDADDEDGGDENDDDSDDSDDDDDDDDDENDDDNGDDDDDGDNGDGGDSEDDGPFRSELKITSTLGFDSNADEAAGGRKSFFVQNEVEAAAEYQKDGLFIRLESEIAHEQDLRRAGEHDLEYAIGAQAGLDLSHNFRLSSGLGLEDDRTESDGTLTTSGFAELSQASDLISSALRGTAEFKFHPDQEDDEENFIANELNYTKLSAAIEIRFLPKKQLSPYLRLSVSDVAFENGGDLNRDAQSISSIAGISAQILGDLRLDLGGRWNAREVSGSWHTGSFLDASLTWKPTDNFEMSALVKREFEETEDADGYFVDVKTYAVGLNWSPNSELELSLEASLSDEKNVGGLTESTEYQVEVESLYALNENMKFVLASSMKMAEEQDEDGEQTEYDQFVVRSGLEVSF